MSLPEVFIVSGEYNHYQLHHDLINIKIFSKAARTPIGSYYYFKVYHKVISIIIKIFL